LLEKPGDLRRQAICYGDHRPLLREVIMSRHNAKSARRAVRNATRHVITTIGDLVAAAYEAAPGLGYERSASARRLLTRSPLARQISPRLRFV
jgi:hypothetical protein